MQKNKQISLLLVLTLVLPMTLFLATPVKAVTIAPTNSEGLVDMWISLTVKGANASRTYQVALNAVNDGDPIYPATDGTFTFTVTILSSGRNTVTVTDTTSSTVVCTAYINGIDFLELLIPLIVLVITVMFALSIMDKIEDLAV